MEVINLLWSNKEVEALKSEYILEGEYYLSNILSKSPNAIRIKASRLGVHKLEYKNSVYLSEVEEQIILGGLMGDLYCRIKGNSKNANIEGSHCKKQEPYMLWKLNLLKALSFNLRRVKNGNLFFESKSYPCLNCYYTLFYNGGKKKVNKEILNKINELGLAIWYMDDGSYKRTHKTSFICTHGFTYEENKLIKDWFGDRWNIFPKISISRDNRPNHKQISYFLTLNVNETKKFIDLIKNYIHPSMNYKIGETFEIKSETNEGA